MERSEFVFDYAQLLYYKCQKRNPNRDESYIDFPYWMKTAREKLQVTDIHSRFGDKEAILSFQKRRSDPFRKGKKPIFIIGCDSRVKL